jgi:membrane protein implicated in regulation of membrane protease activity
VGCPPYRSQAVSIVSRFSGACYLPGSVGCFTLSTRALRHESYGARSGHSSSRFHHHRLHLGKTPNADTFRRHRRRRLADDLKNRPSHSHPNNLLGRPPLAAESMRVAIKHSQTRRQLGVVSSIAAPLLATAAITVIAIIVQDSDSLALPTVALTALALAAGALIISINGSIWAAYCDEEPPGETTASVKAPDMNDNEYWNAVHAYQAYRFWVKINRLSYLIGVYALWIGIAFALVPRPFDPWRLIAIVPVAAGMLAELWLHRFAPRTRSEATYWVEGH